jgi:arginyl-tRNA synthetase
MTFEGNSGPYIQYGYVRANKIITRFKEQNTISIDITGQLTQSEEIDLLNMIQLYPEVREKTLTTHMPHHLCNYIFDLTKSFSSFYNAVHILNEPNEELKMIRIQLVETFCKTIKNTFDILGIELPERM